jgi:hypothetical protein
MQQKTRSFDIKILTIDNNTKNAGYARNLTLDKT